MEPTVRPAHNAYSVHTISEDSTPSASSASSSSTPATMSEQNVALVPVHQDDFKKINEFAEAAWICRDLRNAERIKEMRRNLLKEHNQELIKAIEEKKKKNGNFHPFPDPPPP